MPKFVIKHHYRAVETFEVEANTAAGAKAIFLGESDKLLPERQSDQYVETERFIVEALGE